MITEKLDGDRYVLTSLASKIMYNYAHEQLRSMPVEVDTDQCTRRDHRL